MKAGDFCPNSSTYSPTPRDINQKRAVPAARTWDPSCRFGAILEFQPAVALNDIEQFYRD